MISLNSIAKEIAERRRLLGISQSELAKQARIGHSTLDALENGRLGELGISKIIRVLSALGLELTLQESRLSRPTLEDLMHEEDHDQGLDRQR